MNFNAVASSEHHYNNQYSKLKIVCGNNTLHWTLIVEFISGYIFWIMNKGKRCLLNWELTKNRTISNTESGQNDLTYCSNKIRCRNWHLLICRHSLTFSTAIVLTNSYFNSKILPYIFPPNRKLSNRYNHFSVRVFEEWRRT